MYSDEIKELLNKKNHLITIDEYFKIIDTSPQIDKIKYHANIDEFEIGSMNDDLVLRFKISKKMH